MPALIGLTGEYSGETFVLEGEAFTIGRLQENDMPLEDALVSGMHCSVIFRSERWFIVDHESTNGSYLNGNEISETVLSDQDVITLGSTKFRFVMDMTTADLTPSELLDADEVADLPDVTLPDSDKENAEEEDDVRESIDFDQWLTHPSKNNTLIAMLSIGLLFVVMLLFFTQVT